MKEQLHSRILGEGDPLLILHGFLGMSDNWKTLGNRYAENGLQVHLIDLRNHGKSFWSPEFNFEVLTEDLETYLIHHGLTGVHLLGHSLGGKTAMQFACTHPPLVRKLLVADISPKYYPPHHEEILHALQAMHLENIHSRKEADDALGRNLNDPGIRQFLLKNLYWESKGKLAFRFNLQVLAQKEDEIGENLGPGDRFNGPCLFLRGDNSEYVVPEDLELIKRHFPNARLETIDRAGHWVHADNPDQFLAKSLDFILGP